MKKSVVIIIIVLVIIVGGTIWWSMAGNAIQATAPQIPPATDNMGNMLMASSSTSSVTTTTVTTTSTTTVAGAVQSTLPLSTVANDGGATPQSFTVKAGTQVALTFNVNQTGTYHGGLDFRSSVVNSGTILSGQSGTVTFTATKSFSFTPYWPASNIAKDYTIDIIVQ